MGNTLKNLRTRGFALALGLVAALAFGTVTASAAPAAVAATPITAPAATGTVAETYAVSGTVTGASSTGNAPLAGVSVNAYNGTSVTRSAITDADGQYSVDGLPAGSVYMWFSYALGIDTGLAYTTVRESTSIDSSDIVVDTSLERRGLVSGTVTQKIDGIVTPAANAYVSVTDARSDGYAGSDNSASAYTDAQGRYATSGLAAGTYTVAFGDRETGSGLAPIYWDNELDRATADEVTVEAETAKTGIDAELFSLDLADVTDLSTVSLSGEFAAGQTLTAVASSTTEGAVLTYTWVGGSYRPQTLDKTYLVVEGDLAGGVSVHVTASAPHHLRTYGTASTRDPAPAPTETEAPAPTETEAPAPAPTETPAPAEEAVADLAQTGGVTPAPAQTAAKISPDTANGPAATSFVAGGTIPIAMSGFAPFEVVDIWLYSTPVLLGTLTADADGAISGSFTVPAGTPAGTHHIVLFDEAGTQYTSVDLTVTASASASELAATGASLSPLWFALVIMVLGGVAVLVGRGRRFVNGSSK
jgi:hypothetical protein